LITIALAIFSTAVLFVCALIATPFFFFSSSAAALVDRVTEIVVSPLRIAGSTITELWSQLWRVATGRKSGEESDEKVTVIAAVAIRLALSALCLAAIAIAPISGFWKTLAYILTIAALIIIWTIFILQSIKEPDRARAKENKQVATIVILLVVTAAAISSIVISPIHGHWALLADILLGVGLFAMWLIGIANAWE
jgi:hypothetical protein